MVLSGIGKYRLDENWRGLERSIVSIKKFVITLWIKTEDFRSKQDWFDLLLLHLNKQHDGHNFETIEALIKARK